jgi:signal recognition particle subunit SRP72
LCAQIEGAYFANALKTCDKILRLVPGDQDTIQTKIFLLLQTNQYGAALKLVEEHKANKELQFENAYTLYRLHKEQEVTDLVREQKGSGQNERGFVHLEAQLAYRQGNYDVARDLYNNLLDTCQPDTEEHGDLLTNLSATQTHLDFINQGYLSAMHSISTQTAQLETSGPPSLASHGIPAATVRPTDPKKDTPASAPALPQQPKPPRKSRLPKHVVLGVTPLPDPERWIKKRERTKVETKGRRGAKKKDGMGAGATQGSVTGDMGLEGSTPGVVTSGSGGKKGKKGR